MTPFLKLMLGLTAAWTVALIACGTIGDLSQIQTATSISNCQAAARLADAGDNLHEYDVCMAAAGLHDAGTK